jgi:hypothetical protein
MKRRMMMIVIGVALTVIIKNLVSPASHTSPIMTAAAPKTKIA